MLPTPDIPFITDSLRFDVDKLIIFIYNSIIDKSEVTHLCLSGEPT